MSGGNVWKPRAGDLAGKGRRGRRDRRKKPVRACSGSAIMATVRSPGMVRRAGVNRVGCFPAFQSIVLKNY